jgi:hypothetical protein
MYIAVLLSPFLVGCPFTHVVPVVLPLDHQVKQYIGCIYILCICYVAILVLSIYFVFVLYA